FRCASPSASGNSRSMIAGCVTSPRWSAANAVRIAASASAGPTSERTSLSDSVAMSAKRAPDALDEQGLVRLLDRLEAEDELPLQRHADDARIAGGELAGKLIRA